MHDVRAEKRYPSIAVILSIIGGILILISGLVLFGVDIVGASVIPGVGVSLILGAGVWGIICGIIVIVAGYMVSSRLMSHSTYGIIVLIFSILIFVESGGYIIGGVLGIIGGLWAIFWKPKMEKVTTIMPEKPSEKTQTPPVT
jgi:hypothetical protein